MHREELLLVEADTDSENKNPESNERLEQKREREREGGGREDVIRERGTETERALETS